MFKSMLERILRAQRGGGFYAKAITSALEKLDEPECEALFRLIENKAGDAQQDGRREQSRHPWKRP